MAPLDLSELRATASRQHGVVSTRQLRALGLSESAISHRVARGDLRRLHRGVFAVGPVGEGELTHFAAAVLACWPGALLSHLSAAILWGLIDRADGPVHVTVAGRRPRSRDGIRVHCATAVDQRDRRIRRNLPVTSPSLTVLDLAAIETRLAETALNEGLLHRLTSEAEMRTLLARMPRHRGAARVRGILAAAAGGFSRQAAEKILIDLIRNAGLPEPLRNPRVHGYELDFYWPDLRLDVEMDGYRWHSTRDRLNRDRDRDADLTARGVQVLRISYDQLAEPLRVGARISAAIALATVRS